MFLINFNFCYPNCDCSVLHPKNLQGVLQPSAESGSKVSLLHLCFQKSTKRLQVRQRPVKCRSVLSQQDQESQEWAGIFSNWSVIMVKLICSFESSIFFRTFNFIAKIHEAIVSGPPDSRCHRGPPSRKMGCQPKLAKIMQIIFHSGCKQKMNRRE